MIKITFLLIGISFLFSSCVTMDGSIVSVVHPSPKADSSYFELIESHSKHKHVVHSFETLYKLNVTELVPSVMKGFEARFKTLFLKDQKIIQKDANQVAFFVSLYSPVTREADLANDQEWFSNLVLDNKEVLVEKVVRLKKSKLWNNFFPYVDAYSREFLLFFDISSLKDKKSLGKKITLTLSNTRAQTVISW